ncbi:uncharacterized protein [Physcomitrium patens]|uniref:Uncharacterized protein n=1 Tax=Physcomitrium patens TaxID=3218 RepID=A0A2K1K6D5_PHYPA|nr:uncharacterized protein LOC112286008 [Physcomitrium patens]XP_024383257.1 uncharacterized protein LOC112286008 [Physcomitrium patens]PNR49338.1 hypothetical protein PHYPA_011234 [Physcomitrium patens]|eukprot:XP_024383256.1 uncharacterized protein LOC112286008 [Physcomitrella patens]
MEVKPMSPGSNFTTYSLPTSPTAKNVGVQGIDALVHQTYNLPRPKTASSSSLFRFLLCSRPCFQHYVDVDIGHDDATVDFDEESNGRVHYLDSGCSHEQWQQRMELQAVMRHLEVRWQLFDEALSRFRDLEAMLAICADRVRWRHHTATGVKDAHVAEDLNSLISRKLSMEVSINRITQLLPTGELGATFDRDGYGRETQTKGSSRVEAAMGLYQECRDDFGSDKLRTARLCVLEEDSYTLCNQRGEVVEVGNQLVIWEQYNATWYIRGCISYPANTKLNYA